VSHELCRPLCALRAGFDLLLADVSSRLAPQECNRLLTMVALCDDLLGLARGYLDYAELVSGSRPVCLGCFTIGALVGEIDLQFAAMARARQIHWELHTEQPDAVVTTDASRFQQVFGNLVSNALKYTPTGGQVRVAGNADADSWSVTVSDSGPGIPAESQSAVFEPFFRLAREERAGAQGSGLGLSICHELVRQLGGEVALNSALGQGTSVSVRFPLAERTTGLRAGVRSAPGRSRGGGECASAHEKSGIVAAGSQGEPTALPAAE
jgi:signal transduction histidine kinase